MERRCFGYSPTVILIIYTAVEIKSLVELGKKYQWEKPGQCPNCKGWRLWGHGFVLRYFEFWDAGVWVRRYRCPLCGAVHTMRPDAHYRGFVYTVSTILQSLKTKIRKGCWLLSPSRQVQQYWWRGFRKQLSYSGRPTLQTVEALSWLIDSTIIPGSHSLKYREISGPLESPHRYFACPP